MSQRRSPSMLRWTRCHPSLLPPPTAIQPSTAVYAPIFDINYSFCPFADDPYFAKVPGRCLHQFYLVQTEEARYLKTILEDHVKFPTFPRRLNGDVIVDYHPEYLPITSRESDTNIISNVFLAIFGNYASRLQNSKPVWLRNGLGTCFTMIHFQQAVNSVIPEQLFFQLVMQMTFFLSKLNLRMS